MPNEAEPKSSASGEPEKQEAATTPKRRKTTEADNAAAAEEPASATSELVSATKKDPANRQEAGEPKADGKAAEAKRQEEEEEAAAKKQAKQTKELGEQTELLKKETEQQDAQLTAQEKRREIITKLLAATGGNIPEMFREVNQELLKQMGADQSLKLDGTPDFTADSAAFRVPNIASSVKLDGSTDYFGMKVSDQQLLYDRVGLFKGIVVDHRREVPVDQGYRDILKQRAAKKDPVDPDPHATQPARVFAKKPRLAGFFENTYALDESQRKSQEIGIFNLGIGLSASYSAGFTSAAVKAGYSQGNERQEEQAVSQKKVFITSSFFLPKVELSFDTLQPCASTDFVEAVREVFEQRPEKQFERLLTVLAGFGHFVATSLVIGGRLYSTEEKEISDTSSLRNELNKASYDLKAAVSLWSVEAGTEVSSSSVDSGKTAAQTKRESQNLQLRAVGGEGAHVNNTNLWVESLAQYPAWGLVRFDGLVPSLRVLPAKLQRRCHSLLSETVTAPQASVESLLEKNAHFLFYEGYMELYGRHAQPRYFALKGIASERKVLSIANGQKTNDARVLLQAYEEAPHQEWWLTADGKIQVRHERDEAERYVLTVGGANNDTLVVTLDGFFPNQRWLLAGGLLKSQDVDKYVVIGDRDTLALADLDAARKNRNVWQAATGAQLTRLRELKTPKEVTQAQGERVRLLRTEQYLKAGQKLVSVGGRAVFSFADNTLNTLCVQVDGRDVWTHCFPSVAGKLEEFRLEGGKLFAVDSKGDRHYLHGTTEGVPTYRGDSLELLDNGNLELLDRAGLLAWESDSIVFMTLRRESDDSVLSVHHADFAPDMSYPVIRVTTMPFVGADHQLWYLNRNRQLICKARRENSQKLALHCEESGALSVRPRIDHAPAEQRWLVTDNSPLQSEQSSSPSVIAADNGKILTASAGSQARWVFAPQPDFRGDTSYKLHLCFAGVSDEERDIDGYVNLQENNSHFIHLHEFPLRGQGAAPVGLRGLGLMRYHARDNRDAFGNRLALRASTTAGEVQSQEWGDDQYAAFDKEAVYVDLAPVYFPKEIDAIGFYNKGDRFAIKAKKGGKEYTNKDDGQRLQLFSDAGFLDTSLALAGYGDTVVGAGLARGRHRTNRVCVYLLVVREEKRP